MKAAEHIRERTLAQKKELLFPDYWNEADVRGALHAMQGWACAHCHRQLENNRGYVDHFRPKKGGQGVEHTGYWWLAYAFDNFLLACGVCNTNRKGNQFPLDDGMRPIEYAARSFLKSEGRLLIDPVEDFVDEWMRVDWMSESQEGFVKVRQSVKEGSLEERRASKNIQFFRLNSDLELMRSRVRKLRSAAKAIRQNNRNKVHYLACRYFPYGTAVHNFVEDFDSAWLPSQKEELLLFLGEVKDKLKLAHGLCKELPNSDSCQREVEELLWVLAFVWKDPPRLAMTGSEIECWLDEQGLKDIVAPRHEKLYF